MINFLKEFGIAAALCVAVVLIYAIAFYDYVPINKVVPETKTYEVSEDIKKELADDVTINETQPRQITYSVTQEDLKQYEDATVYQPGNLNPFKPNPVEDSNVILDGTASSTTNGGSSSSSNGGSSSGGIQYHYETNSSLK